LCLHCVSKDSSPLVSVAVASGKKRDQHQLCGEIIGISQNILKARLAGRSGLWDRTDAEYARGL
jgi:hypothetical protein